MESYHLAGNTCLINAESYINIISHRSATIPNICTHKASLGERMDCEVLQPLKEDLKEVILIRAAKGLMHHRSAGV